MSSNNDIFQNSAYNFSRLPKKTLIVKWLSETDNKDKIKLKLVEPLKIDELSDIYLDNFTTYHQKTSTEEEDGEGGTTNTPLFNSHQKSAFVLNINEFDIRTNIAGNVEYTATDPPTRNDNNIGKVFRNIIIPADSLSGEIKNKITKSHKSKKMNYICSINPTIITQITGSITSLDGGNMFEFATTGEGEGDEDMFLAEFVIVARK